MGPATALLTRAESSTSSIGSHIDVGPVAADDSADEPSASTPPTSVSDSRSMNSSKAVDESTPTVEGSTRRTRRARPNASYNLKQLSDAQLPATTTSRNASGLSGRTLVDKAHDDEQDASLGDKLDKALNKDWEIPNESPQGKLPARVQRKSSIKDRVKNAAGKAGSVLGKRTRDMVETGRRRLGMTKEEESPQKNKLLKELDLGKGGVLDEMDLEEDFAVPQFARPTKRSKTEAQTALREISQPVTTGRLQKTSDGKRVKKWQPAGLFAGQDEDADPAHAGSRKKLQKKRPGSSASDAAPEPKKRSFMPLPMFSYLDNSRDFVIPYDVFAPSWKKGDEKPKDWHKINKNRLVGDAKELWDRSERLAQSACVCPVPAKGEAGCDETCLNRVMQYECGKDNCILDPSMCSNRPFAELGERIKKGGSYDIGVEVVKTDKRGFGIRACRSFRPGQIIMEYTGEIISEAECQRRMREDYKDKSCYYLMELERNLVIDGTRGSMARFINHCCDPNCEVRMLKVGGTPRMAVFAGDSGIMTGEELTYDYNFDNFGETRQPCYCGAANCRGYLGKRLNAAEQKKQAKLEEERRREAAALAAKAAAKELAKKKEKDSRGSGWRGWVAVDDPEIKAKLKEQKLKAEEEAKNSSRAQRMAARARRGSTTGAEPKPSPAKKRSSPRRRKTTAVDEIKRRVSAVADDEVVEDEDAIIVKKNTLRRTSTGSRFTEDLDLEKRPASRPTSRHSAYNRATGIVKRTSYSVKSAKSSMDIKRQPIAEDDDNIVLTKKLSNANGRSRSKVSSTKEDDDEMDVDEDEEEGEDEDDEEEPMIEKPKRNSSIFSLANLTGKWKQTKLTFGKAP
ncbi:hypothetical protein PRZ48_013364 [Zasmidium cellare]|uniref:SET domain-containing protein n=1 Tax=Zasmidium cellare TaxID=395010 RepID=A0ABR0E0T6_ZASCE|nr:hypothetical protein PRZ48_013364 [Zasmidium cellare]